LAGEGFNVTEYNPDLAVAILGEAAHLLRHLGIATCHTILIGGLVPGLLVLDPGPGRAAHVGTTDLDFCLSLALVEGDTGAYERIETSLRTAGYQPTDKTFCWQRLFQTGASVASKGAPKPDLVSSSERHPAPRRPRRPPRRA
jgi:hypothetical protein